MPATGSGGSDVRLLRTLLVLGDELHVGRAAQRLHLTQPAVSKHLAQLERSTGLALCSYATRAGSPRPTRAGC